MHVIFVESVMSGRRDSLDVLQHVLLLFIGSVKVDTANECATFTLGRRLLLLRPILRVVLLRKIYKTTMVRHGTSDAALFIGSTDFGQVARCQTTDHLLAIAVKEVALGGSSDSALHSRMVLRCRYSDTRHGR